MQILDLETVKCNEKDFLENIERIDKHMYHEDGQMKDIQKHLVALDHYLDRYQPARLQRMITCHLDACLMGDTRVQHQHYNDDVIQYYYKLILADDDEKLKIQNLILKLHKEARVEVDAHEKAKRERAAVVAASQSITSEEMANMKA